MDPQTSTPPTTQQKPASNTLPVIDVSALVSENPTEENLKKVAQAISDACQNWGFFYIINHGVSEKLQEQLETLSKQFFALPEDVKMKIPMSNGGRAWRGFFPVGGELTSGKPDLKEGLYLGTELPSSDPRVQEGLPLHGPNLWPEEIPELKTVVLEWLAVMEKLARAVMKGIALSLDLAADYFEKNYLEDPTCLFRIFNYPPDVDANQQGEPRWGVGEHTDYGLLTILKQDNSGGLQVNSPHHGWTPAQPIPNSFVCNLGDMLQAVTNGLYLSTPHRVQNVYTGKDRQSYPFFFDPSWNAEIKPLPLSHLGIKDITLDEFVNIDASKRWDKASPQSFRGKYGEYLLTKVSKVFPDLKQNVL